MNKEAKAESSTLYVVDIVSITLLLLFNSLKWLYIRNIIVMRRPMLLVEV